MKQLEFDFMKDTKDLEMKILELEAERRELEALVADLGDEADMWKSKFEDLMYNVKNVVHDKIEELREDLLGNLESLDA